MRTHDSAHGAMTPDQRRREVAEILAAAVVRLRLRAALPEGQAVAQKPLETSSNCLEVRWETRLSVPHGLPLSETSRR
jgi:hypothetical protein